MAASNPPKGSASSSSIKPVTRKAVRCQREVAWLVTQAAGRLVATTEDVNAPTPSFVLAAALERVRQLELAAQEAGNALDYQGTMAPDLSTFCRMAKLPAAPNALSDAGYMFTLSGADLIRDIYAYCSELAERRVFDAAEVKPGNVIKLVLRLFLMDEFWAMPAQAEPLASPSTGQQPLYLSGRQSRVDIGSPRPLTHLFHAL